VISTSKIKFIVIILIIVLLVMFWHGCFSRNSFSLEIIADEVYSIAGFRYGVGDRYITCRNEIQRIVRRLNSYRLTPMEPSEIVVMGETPRVSMVLFDEGGYRGWVIVMRGERQMQIAQTPVGYEGLRDWHRIRGFRGWFAPRVLE